MRCPFAWPFILMNIIILVLIKKNVSKNSRTKSLNNNVINRGDIWNIHREQWNWQVVDYLTEIRPLIHTNIYLLESYLSMILLVADAGWRQTLKLKSIYFLSKPEEKENCNIKHLIYSWDYHQHSVVIYIFFAEQKFIRSTLFIQNICVSSMCIHFYLMQSNVYLSTLFVSHQKKWNEMKWKANDECIHEPNLWIKFFIWAVQKSLNAEFSIIIIIIVDRANVTPHFISVRCAYVCIKWFALKYMNLVFAFCQRFPCTQFHPLCTI